MKQPRAVLNAQKRREFGAMRVSQNDFTRSVVEYIYPPSACIMISCMFGTVSGSVIKFLFIARASQHNREIVLLPSLSFPITNVIGHVNSALSVFSMMSILIIESNISFNLPIRLRGTDV